jgi:hypothetical protein
MKQGRKRTGLTGSPMAARVATAIVFALALGCAGQAAGQQPEPMPAPAAVGWADFGSEQVSPEARHVAGWAVHSGDHGSLPFIVVDKVNGQLFVFDAQGRIRGGAPALVGSARGDHSVPGIGSRKISSILPQERTTPAGRFVAQMGHGPGGEDVLWVDYEGAVAIHRVSTGVAKDRRLQRLESKVALDRRITYGCINLPVKFYESMVAPMFKGFGGIVYVLPELRPARDLFGSYEVPRDRPDGTPARASVAP